MVSEAKMLEFQDQFMEKLLVLLNSAENSQGDDQIWTLSNYSLFLSFANVAFR